LLKTIGGFPSAIGRVDIDQDGADRRGSKLQDNPLRPICRPDADMIAPLHADRKQGTGAFVNVGAKLSVAATIAEVWKHKGIMLAKALGGRIEDGGESETGHPGGFGVVHNNLFV